MTLFRHSMAYCSDLLTLTRTILSFSAAAVVLRLLVLTLSIRAWHQKIIGACEIDIVCTERYARNGLHPGSSCSTSTTVTPFSFDGEQGVAQRDD